MNCCTLLSIDGLIDFFLDLSQLIIYGMAVTCPNSVMQDKLFLLDLLIFLLLDLAVF